MCDPLKPSLQSNLEDFLKSSHPKAKDKDVEVACKNLLRKIRTPGLTLSPDKTEVESYLTYNIWKRVTDKNQEFDQVVVDKNSSLFNHFEVKSVERLAGKQIPKGLPAEYHKACEQIRLGRKMFQDVIAPVCNLSANWAYQGQSS